MRIMRDSTNPYDIPLNGMDIAAGYIDGIYKWPAGSWARFTGKKIVRIACFANSPAEILDVENFDATPMQAPAWAAWMRRINIVPTIYCNRDNHLKVVGQFIIQKIPPPLYIVATLDGTKLPLGGNIIGCQYAGQNQTHGHYDESIVADFWPGVDKSMVDMATIIKFSLANAAASLGVILTDTELDVLRLKVDATNSNIMSVIAEIAAKKPNLSGAHSHA